MELVTGRELVQRGILLRQQRQPKEALACFELASTMDTPEAFGYLAQARTYGEGCDIDETALFAAAQRGHELGDPMSTAFVGWCYSRGVGVTRDRARGFALCEQSARSGNGAGLYHLATCYYLGLHVPPNSIRCYELTVPSNPRTQAIVTA